MDESSLSTVTRGDSQADGAKGLPATNAIEMALTEHIMAHTREGIVVMDARGRVEQVNAAFCRLSEREAEQIKGMHITGIDHDLHGRRHYRQIWLQLQRQGHWQGEVQHQTRQGRLAAHWLVLRLIKNHHQQVVKIIGILDDISRLRQSEARLNFLAHHDALTGTANRTQLLAWFANARGALPVGQQLALLFIDLDRFKPINDSFGHGVGDRVLRALAQRLLGLVGEHELVARIGGDEFVMIWQGEHTEASLLDKAQQLLGQLEAPVPVDDYELSVGASIGVSLYPQHGLEIESLLRYADTAMYEAKKLTSAKVCVFDKARFTRLEQQYLLTREFREAIAQDQLFLEYQPGFELGSSHTGSLEALLRWNHPRLGILYPEQFMSAAQGAGLLCRLAEWVLRQAVRQVHDWQQIHGWQGRVSLNLTGLELEQHWASRLLQLLDQLQVAPEIFCLELSCDFIMRRSESLGGALTMLRQAGLSIYLDNVGIGRIHFDKLRQLPLDGIKLDRSLFSDRFDDTDQALVKALMLLSDSLGLNVVACGVETREQLAFLRRHGCHTAQGWLLARPMAAHRVANLYAGDDRHHC
ncbi:putative bifunctional diguanylate cyclase/phosphodiesterase [Zobellella maritima]|uniref:putative bifunctional diguanylate cyclase/phosphodiesterase n=1 Tax=Zobellella maritima TaxID=2059725 RepID=UPI0018E54F3F|nr:EAL domain-containing protein [Zobellella maritima]